MPTINEPDVRPETIPVRRAAERGQLQPDRHAWLQVLRGAVTLNGQSLATSDGAAVSGETDLAIRAGEPAEVMVFDLA